MITRTLKCDLCKEETFITDGTMQLFGGMNGLTKRIIPDEKGELKEQVLQYNLDFCEKCNKKMIDYYFKLGGK